MLVMSLLVATFTLSIASGAGAQDVQEWVLAQPNAQFGHEFTYVAAVRELPDGRLIVVDQSEVAVVIIDPAESGAKLIGRTGSGPEEYLFPIGLLPIPADSLFLVDRGNLRLLGITPSGELGGVINVGAVGGGFDAVSLPTASDTMGALYSRGHSIILTSSTMEYADSVAIERWTVGADRRDTVAFVSVERYPEGTGGRNLPFSTTPLWTVAEDGRIAVIHPDPYWVTLIQRNGERQEGPQIGYDPVRLTEGHKEQWRERLTPTSRVVRGQSGATWSMERAGSDEPPTWPRYLPPFLSMASFATDGMLWVQRTVPATEPPLFDVFDESCRVVGRVRLPAGTRLVGFGRESVFLVRRDEFDLEYIDRYALPQLRSPSTPM